jgi:hypothetical protein
MDMMRELHQRLRGRTHRLRTSWKKYTPRAVCKTDLTAAENMCVTGEVTLMLSRPATQMANPVTP